MPITWVAYYTAVKSQTIRKADWEAHMPREESNPSPPFLDLRGFLLPLCAPVFQHSPRFAHRDILEMTEALTEGKWPVRCFPTPTREVVTSHSVSGFPASGITRLFPTSNLRCFSIKLTLWMINTVLYWWTAEHVNSSFTSIIFHLICTANMSQGKEYYLHLTDEEINWDPKVTPFCLQHIPGI